MVGGKFMTYFTKMLVDTNMVTSDGTVKQSTSLGTASTPSIVTLNGNNVQINGGDLSV